MLNRWSVNALLKSVIVVLSTIVVVTLPWARGTPISVLARPAVSSG